MSSLPPRPLKAALVVRKRTRFPNNARYDPEADFRGVLRAMKGLWSDEMPLVHSTVQKVESMLAKNMRPLHVHWHQRGVELLPILPQGCLTLFCQWFGLQVC